MKTIFRVFKLRSINTSSYPIPERSKEYALWPVKVKDANGLDTDFDCEFDSLPEAESFVSGAIEKEGSFSEFVIIPIYTGKGK